MTAAMSLRRVAVRPYAWLNNADVNKNRDSIPVFLLKTPC